MGRKSQPVGWSTKSSCLGSLKGHKGIPQELYMGSIQVLGV